MKTSVSDAVYEILEGLHSMHPAMREGLINYSALARYLKPYVQQKLGNNPVSEDAIVMASRRFVAHSLDSRESKKLEELLSHCTLLVREQMANIYFVRTSQLYKKLAEFASTKVRWEMGEKMYVIQRSEEILVIVSKKFLPDLLKLAPEKQVMEFVENLTLFSVAYDEGVIHTPGVYLYFLQKLEGINIVSFFSTWRMISFLFSEKDASVAYERLNREFISLRQRYRLPPSSSRFGYED
ncbi:hypothetical protein KJ765_04425 [Candidatus Micrarchaeota archaeon]|nr:hypothetical protein [Candidatus Micrarchaeota archaeon]